MIQNKDHQNVVHATFSSTSFNAVSSKISNRNLMGSCVLIDGNWHLGPLKNRNTKNLSAWFSEHLGYVPENLSTDVPAVGIGVKIFAWVDPLSPEEYMNFIHWVSAQRKQDFFLISPPSDAIDSTTMKLHDLASLLNDASDKKANDIKRYIQEWKKLTDENSDFRLTDRTGKVQSLPSSHFDSYIIDSIANDWEPSPMVVLRIMGKLDSENQPFPGDMFLYHRLEKFCLNGMIEKQTSVSITQTLVRATSA